MSDPTTSRNQGRDAATKNAKTKADQMANAAGVTVGAPIYIEETSTAAPPPVPMSVGSAAPAAAPVQTPISAGTQEVTTTVRVVYSIK